MTFEGEFWAKQRRAVEDVAALPRAVPEVVERIERLLRTAYETEKTSQSLSRTLGKRLDERSKAAADAMGDPAKWWAFRAQDAARTPTSDQLSKDMIQETLRYGIAIKEFRAALRAARLSWQDLCAKCRYNRRGLPPDDPCPNCGTVPPTPPE